MAGLVAGVLLAAPAATAQGLAEAQQAVDHIVGVLASYQRASLIPETSLVGTSWPERQSRHAYESGLELAQRVNLLSRFLGVPEPLTLAAPPADVTPAQLVALVQQADTAIGALAPRFGDPPRPPLPARSEQPTGADITRRLQEAITAIAALGLPEAVPNDASALALVLLSELEQIRQARGKGQPAEQQAPDQRRTIVDALRQLQLLSRTLTDLAAAQPVLAPPGGVARLPTQDGTPTITQLIEPLRALLADVRVIGAQLNPNHRPVPLAALTGQTPAHVYATLRMAVMTAQALR